MSEQDQPDWRVRLTFADEQAARKRAEEVEAARIEQDIAARMGNRIVASRDGAQLFLYADSEDAARAAHQVVVADLQADDWHGDAEIARWHDDAEDWEAAAKPVPRTPEEHRVERMRLMEREDEETREQHYADWEVRLDLPSHRDAQALERSLAGEGIPAVRRWKHLLVGASDEDAANQWADRLRREAPAGTKVSVEGTFASVAGHNPFAWLGGASGGP